MNNLTLYHSNCGKLQVGDFLVFFGDPLSPLSGVIEKFGGGPSHTAFVRQPCIEGRDVVLSNSTIEGGKSGVQDEYLGEVLANYGPRTTAAALLLNDATRAKIDWFKFYEICGSATNHIKYPIIDLFEFLARAVPVLGNYVFQGEHKDVMVCTAWVIAAYTHCGLFTGINWTKTTPQDIVEMQIFKGWLPLLGNPRLHDFNSVGAF